MNPLTYPLCCGERRRIHCNGRWLEVSEKLIQTYVLRRELVKSSQSIDPVVTHRTFKQLVHGIHN